MKDKTTWLNGLKTDTTLDNNLDVAIERVKLNKAWLGVIDGGIGEGKTTLAVILGQRIAHKLGEDFDISNQVTMGGKEFLKGMAWCVKNKRRVIIYDEAGDFNTRASLTYFNQTMNRVFETYRALGILVIVCLPSFADIDMSLMKKQIVRLLIHCFGRTNTFGQYKVYSLWRLWYVKSKMQKFTIPTDAYKNVRENFRGRFRNLNPNDSKLLATQSIKGKKKIIKEGLIKQMGLVTIREICEKTGYADKTIRLYITKHKIQGEKQGATLYYKKQIIQNLIERKERMNSITS